MLLHRFRADRLLQEEFESLRAGVMRNVAARLRGAGVQLDADDLEACYAAAWHGLYAAVLEGQKIDSPAAWLTLVTHRRAIDEHRARRHIEFMPLDDCDDANSSGADARALSRVFATAALTAAQRRDLAADLDDRMRIGQLLEALRARLSSRECEAATLCYLLGLSRAEAAAQMGISESRMRKLMEGRGSARPGVCAKLGALVETIDAGRWCEAQGSLMRGFAYGILDPRGERYTLARAHHSACPSCRAYVLSLRGLAAVLPPVPAMLHWALGAGVAGVASGAGSGAAGSGAAAVGGAGSGSGAASGAGAAVPGGSGTGAAALSASGAAGASAGVGAAGGGWWLAGGPLGAKLAVGCLLALGVGAGCVALEGRPHGGRAASHGRLARTGAARRSAVSASEGLADDRAAATVTPPSAANAPAQGARQSTAVAGAARATREFGPEQGGRREAPPAHAASETPTAVAHSASVGAGSAASSAAIAPTSAPRGGSGASTAAPVSAAAREFAPG
jgi:RNA polymerase sigma factor (sigma-70 family)